MVSTWTASASESSRSARSSSALSRSASAMRCRSQDVSEETPSCCSVATVCSSWPTCPRSVSRRSPPSRPRTRRGTASVAEIESSSAATPRLRRRPAQRWNFACSSSQAGSSAAAICSALQPRKEVSAADRARALETGRSTASSSRSHSSAAGVAKTLPAPLMTAGTPARSSASSTSAASLFVGTRTAMWRGRTGSRRSLGAVRGAGDQSRGR